MDGFDAVGVLGGSQDMKIKKYKMKGNRFVKFKRSPNVLILIDKVIDRLKSTKDYTMAAMSQIKLDCDISLSKNMFCMAEFDFCGTPCCIIGHMLDIAFPDQSDFQKALLFPIKTASILLEISNNDTMCLAYATGERRLHAIERINKTMAIDCLKYFKKGYDPSRSWDKAISKSHRQIVVGE